MDIAYIQRPTPTANDDAVRMMLDDFGHDVIEVPDTSLPFSTTWNLLSASDLIVVRASDTTFDPARLPSGVPKLFGNRFMFETWNMTTGGGLGTVVDAAGPVEMDPHNLPMSDSGWTSDPDPDDPVTISLGAGLVLGIPVAQQPSSASFVVLGYHAGTSLATVVWRPGRVFMGYVGAAYAGLNYPAVLARCIDAAVNGPADYPGSTEPPRTTTAEPADDGAVDPDVGQGNPILDDPALFWWVPQPYFAEMDEVTRRPRIEVGSSVIPYGVPVAADNLQISPRSRVLTGDAALLERGWFDFLAAPGGVGSGRAVNGSPSILDRHIRVAGSAVQVERAIRVGGDSVVVVPGA